MESPAPRSVTDVFPDDAWCLFRVSKPSVLLIGADADVERAIQLIIASELTAIALWSAVEGSPLPAADATTVLVRHVASLDRQQQERLHRWLGDRSGAVRVIATSPVPLYDLVEQHRFLEPLYYRINVVCLDTAAFESAAV
jgi:hypothetical protein